MTHCFIVNVFNFVRVFSICYPMRVGNEFLYAHSVESLCHDVDILHKLPHVTISFEGNVCDG